jgi:hypothetical protein
MLCLLDDGSKREIGYRAEPRYANFFAVEAAQIANIGTNEQRLGKVRGHCGDLDDITAAQDVGDDGWTAKTCDIGRAGKHRLNNHRRRADVHHIEVQAVLLEDADFFSHYPGDAVEPERTVREGEFDRLLRKNQTGCRR